METPVYADLKMRMKKAVESLKQDMASIRTGRATTSLLEHVVVESYGSRMSIAQVASVNVPEARMITIQPWDKGTTQHIIKAIQEADLGLNPIHDGPIIRVPVPELTEQRRKELVKVVNKFSEQAKVVVRNIRRDGMELLKKAEKNKELAKDELRVQEKAVQDLTDQTIQEIEKIAAQKEADVMHV